MHLTNLVTFIQADKCGIKKGSPREIWLTHAELFKIPWLTLVSSTAVIRVVMQCLGGESLCDATLTTAAEETRTNDFPLTKKITWLNKYKLSYTCIIEPFKQIFLLHYVKISLRSQWLQMFLLAFNSIKSAMLHVFNFPWLFFKMSISQLKIKFPGLEELFSLTISWPVKLNDRKILGSTIC